MDTITIDSDEDIVVLTDSDTESSGQEVDYGLSIGTEPEPSTSNEKMDVEVFPFEVLTTENIVKHMIDCIREVNTIVEIPPTTTRILLNYFKWDIEKLYERYFGGDQEGLFRDAKVISPNKKPLYSTELQKKSSGLLECGICFRDLPPVMMTGLDCTHRFCTDCWVGYLTTQIMDEGMGQTIPCAAHLCEILVDDQTVMKLIKDSKVKLKYQHLITNSFVECNRLLRWCPQPDCTNAIKVQYVDAQAVACSCGHTFCFSCGKNWHDPIKCDLLVKWEKKCLEDAETINWIAVYTKDCPNCHVSIEKNGGCNHMVCRKCAHAFCWACLGPWISHNTSYACNRFEEGAKTDAQAKSRASIDRYLFYYNRYTNHMQSHRFENNLYGAVQQKMEKMIQDNMSSIEVQFLKKAVDVLSFCRQTLMYTYVFAHYLKKNNQSVIFEENQRDLEKATEKLSGYFERDLDQEDLRHIKPKVQDMLWYCDSRRKVLLDHVQEGYDKELWEYTE